jgi:hypothetical protein
MKLPEPSTKIIVLLNIPTVIILAIAIGINCHVGKQLRKVGELNAKTRAMNVETAVGLEEARKKQRELRSGVNER